MPLRPGIRRAWMGYAVVGVSPGREAWAGRAAPHPEPLGWPGAGLMLLDALLEQVKAGRGQVVSLVGAPGMGKSRLLAEFRQRLSGQRVQYAEGHCLAYGQCYPLSAPSWTCCGITAASPRTIGPEMLTTKMRAGARALRV